jgi:hypothetical protein
LIAALAVTSATAMAATASAEIVCSTTENVCWHVHRHYVYRPDFGVVVHPDSWRWADTDHYSWREHAGRGYWRGGVWVAF